MKDDHKTKKQLVHELTELRSQNAVLKKSESAGRYRSLVEDFRGVESPSEYRIKNKSGEYKWARTTTRPIMEDGLFKGTRGILIDITAQRRTEEALRESEEKYRLSFENVADVIYMIDTNLNVLSVSPSVERILGYKPQDFIGRPVSNLENIFTPESFEQAIADASLILKGETIAATIYRFIAKDGTLKYGEVSGSPVMRDDKIIGMISVARDVTDRKRAEEKLQDSEELFRSYLEYAPDGVYMSDVKGTFLYGNRKCEEIIGYQREELIGKNLLELNLLPEKSLNKAAQLLQANIEGKSTGPDEIELISKEGRHIPVEINTNVVQSAGEGIVLAFVRNITNRKRAEEALRESEEKYRWVLDNITDVITVMDMNLRFTYVSPSIMRMRGYTADEAMAQTFEQVMTPESLQISARVFEEEMNLEASGTADPGRIRIVEVEQYRKDGSIVLMENHLSFMRDEAKKAVGIISVSHDITERKRTEEQLRHTLDSLRKAFGATIQAMVSAVESRDPYTAGHQIRSADLARAIATEMGLPQEKIEGIRIAGSIHDIGKLSIPAEILSKPTKLTNLEFSLIKEHAQKGYEMLKDVESPWPLAEIVYQHHERMDASGYPRNLKGDDILIEARIMAVADVVESMASHRPYRPALGLNTALEEISKNRGILYDPVVVDACLRLFREKRYKLE